MNLCELEFCSVHVAWDEAQERGRKRHDRRNSLQPLRWGSLIIRPSPLGQA